MSSSNGPERPPGLDPPTHHEEERLTFGTFDSAAAEAEYELTVADDASSPEQPPPLQGRGSQLEHTPIAQITTDLLASKPIEARRSLNFGYAPKASQPVTRPVRRSFESKESVDLNVVLELFKAGALTKEDVKDLVNSHKVQSLETEGGPTESESGPDANLPVSFLSQSKSLMPAARLSELSYSDTTKTYLKADEFVPVLTGVPPEECSKVYQLRVNELPTFEGRLDENPGAFLLNFHGIITAKLLLPAHYVNAVKLCMRAGAQRWFTLEYNRGLLSTWEDFVMRFQMRYVDLSQFAFTMSTLSRLQQRNNQSVSEFQQYFDDLLLRVNYVHPEMHSSWLRRGLRPDLLERMNLTSTYTPPVQELFSLANQAEVTLKEARKLDRHTGHLLTTPPATQRSKSHVRAMRGKTGRVAKDFVPPSFQQRMEWRTTHPGKSVCWRCHEPGHAYPDCKGTPANPKQVN